MDLPSEDAEISKLAKRLKKEKVNVDIVSFGDCQKNNDLLTNFINVLNGKDGTGSHLVSVPRGSQLQEALLTSPIIQGKSNSARSSSRGSTFVQFSTGEDGLGGAGLGGAGFEFGVDPNEDPELALVRKLFKIRKNFFLLFNFQALRVSMEEQRQRQEEEQRRATAESAQETETAGQAPAVSTVAPTSDEAMLERALALSTETPVKRHRVRFVSVLNFFWAFLCVSKILSRRKFPPRRCR